MSLALRLRVRLLSPANSADAYLLKSLAWVSSGMFFLEKSRTRSLAGARLAPKRKLEMQRSTLSFIADTELRNTGRITSFASRNSFTATPAESNEPMVRAITPSACSSIPVATFTLTV